MINVQVNENEVRQLYLEKLEEKIKEFDAEFVFWDANELKKRTCMSWNTIQKEFFFNPRFPKRKVGNKWYFPTKATKQFLLDWLKEQ